MLKALKVDDSTETSWNPEWLNSFNEGFYSELHSRMLIRLIALRLISLLTLADFKRRFLSLLSYEFRDFPPALALSVLNYKPNTVLGDQSGAVRLNQIKPELDFHFSPFDIKRLNAYSSNLVDYHVILDLLPTISRFYFLGKFCTVAKDEEAEAFESNGETQAMALAAESLPGLSLSYAQAAIILCLGLQHKTVDQVVSELTIQSNQVLALFTKIIKKITKHLRTLQEWAIDKQLPRGNVDAAAGLRPLEKTLDEELAEKGAEALENIKQKQEELLKSLGDQ